MAKFPIITLCGSTKFSNEYIKYNKDLSMAGAVVLSVGLFGHKTGLDMSGDIKKRLDKIHFQKIDMSDAIFVINKGGYIGLSTCDEILYAMANQKSVFFMEPVPKDKAKFLMTLDNSQNNLNFSVDLYAIEFPENDGIFTPELYKILLP